MDVVIRTRPYRGLVVARTRLYREGKVVSEEFPVEDISSYLGESDVCVWLDYCSPTSEELASIAQEFELHPLAVEDAVTEHERPKLDRYDSHLFLSAYAVELDTATATLSSSEIDAFVMPNALVTVRHDDRVDIDSIVRRWDDSGDLAKNGVSFLLWGLLDHIVDGHFEAVQSLDTEIESLEDLLFDDAPRQPEVQRRSFRLRKSLVLLRRLVLPMREVVNSIMRRDLHVLDERMVPYYQDVYDHVLRATEWTESLRDLVGTILETRITMQGNRLNEVMKKLTSWAAIIAIPTLITGYFGMNVPYPGFSTKAGFDASIITMVLAGLVLYFVFKRKDWL